VNRNRGDMRAFVCKDKHDIHMLANTHAPSAEGNFCDNMEIP
jgi:hypothetical protein